jgi:hypothetical protein
MKGLGMDRIAAYCVTLVLVFASAAQVEADPLPVEVLLRHLGHEDHLVREAAAGGLLARGFEMIAPLTGAAQGNDLSLAGEAETIRRLLVLAHRLSKASRNTPAFWMLLEEVHDMAPGRLRRATLLLALKSSAEVVSVSDRRETANVTVRTFCRDWNEMWAPGSAEEKRYAVLRKALESAGPAAAPHLMKILDVHQSRAFCHTDRQGGVTARMQVRAVFGLVFLGAREAVPYCLVHMQNMSVTAGANAAAAFVKLTSGKLTPDEKSIADWWSAHREDYPHGTRWATRALLHELHRDAAFEIVGIPFHVLKNVVVLPGAHVNRRQATVRVLETLTGRKAKFDAPAPAKMRLAQIRAMEERFEVEVFK